MTDLLDQQPLFPLPNVVLFPKGFLPLHVFEPRYRTMMDEVLRGGQTICMALLKPGWEADYQGAPPVYDTACVGRVVQHQLLPDGRYTVTLRGESKVAIESFAKERPFRVARVRLVEEDGSWAAGADAAAQVAELLALYRRVHQSQGAAIALAQLLDAHLSPEAVINTVAMHVNVEPRVKQRLLELESLGRRFRAVYRYLRDSAATQDLLDRVRHLYPDDRRVN